jgi:toxin CcdB
VAQFCVYRNPSASSGAALPYLLDVQSDLMDSLATTVVVPLRPVSTATAAFLGALTPVFEVEGAAYVMLTPQLAGILRKQVGQRVVDLSSRRDDILAALELLTSGI